MDIETYLEQMKGHVGQQANQIKDFSVFDFNYIPDQPIMREECKEIIDAMLRFDISGIPAHQAIIGSRGSGKTLMLKFLQKIIPNQTGLDVVYANCRHHNTSYKIFSHLLKNSRYGASLNDLYEQFMAKYRKRTVVVLDEIDLMSPKDKRRDILYMLSRSEQPYMVIMLSNSPHVLKQLDAATRSSLQPIPIHFKNYDAQQVKQILYARAQKGLYSWDDGDLSRIAALTTKMTNADVRAAIKTLHYHVTGLYSGINECFEKARKDIIVDMINDLSDTNLTILWAIATNRSELVKPIYDCYCRFVENTGEKPFSYMYFYSHLSYLQSVGLVALISTKVDRTYTNRVMLTCESDVVETISKLRFE